MPISQYCFSQSLIVKEAPVDVFQFQVIYKYNVSVRKILSITLVLDLAIWYYDIQWDLITFIE